MKEWRYGHNPFFIRLFLFNVVMIVIITVIQQFIHYEFFFSSYNKEIEKFNMQTVKQFRNSVDGQILKPMIDTVNQEFSEPESEFSLRYPFSHNMRKDVSSVLRMIQRLEYFKARIPFAESVDMYYKTSGLLFYGSRMCYMSDSGCDLGYRNDWFDRFNSTDAEVDWLSPRPNSDMPPKQIITYVRSIPYFAPLDKRQGVIAINIDENILHKTLMETRSAEDGILFIMDEKGRVVSDNQPSGTLSKDGPEDGQWARQILDLDSSGMFTSEWNGTSTVVSFAKSEYNTWRYVSIAEKNAFYKRANALRNLLLLLSLSFLVFNVMISFWLTKKAHKPIRNTLHDYSNQIGDLTGKLEAHQPIIRHNYILSLLKGTHDGHSLPSEHNLVNLQFQHDQFFCFVLMIRKQPDMSIPNVLAVSYAIMDRLENNDDPAYRIWAVQEEGRKIQGIINVQAQASADREALVQQIHARIHEITNVPYVLCYGNAYPLDTVSISKSYDEACEAANYAYIRPDQTTISYEELHIGTLRQSGGSVKILDGIEDCLRAGNAKRLLQIIHAAIDEVESGQYIIEYCKNILMDVVSTLRKAVEGMGFSSSEMFGCDIREAYKKQESIRCFTVWIEEVAELAIQRIHERKQHIDKELETRIKTFIETNLYTNNLSLESLAEHVGITSQYLSRIFKISTGVTFIEYVTELKLNEATRLLKEKKLSVNEIAGKLGYHSTNHFIRIFKEKHGKTPKQYQKFV